MNDQRPTKHRLDVLLVARGLVESREKAQRVIRAGLVHSGNELLDKPGRMVAEDEAIFIKQDPAGRYVSRGGLKLEGALAEFRCDVTQRVALDIGASTGGFTDCLLQHGAVRIYAVDVGRGQLHQRLIGDARVVSREKTHLDELRAEDFDPAPELCVADLSFISLRRAFPVIRRVMPWGEAILLVKPQFEVGREQLPRGGVVKDEALQRRVLGDLAEAARAEGFEVLGDYESPITGGDGNREFFLHLRIG
ncbi:TlyA family RNA methyltransferase [soil metagenome]